MTQATDQGFVTGTADKDYDLVWFMQTCLSNTMRLQTYTADAERAGDEEMAELFRKAQADSRKGAEMSRTILARRLADDSRPGQ